MASKSTPYHPHIWKLPSISPQEKVILCNGFVRNNYTEYMILPITSLIATFYTTDHYSLSEVINGDIGSRFHGPMLCINSFKFFIEFYPNGTTEEHSGQIAGFFCIATLPPNVEHITMDFQFSLKETNSKTSPKAHRYTTDRYWKGIYSTTSVLKGLQTLTFEVNINNMKASYKDGHTIILPNIHPITNPFRELKPQHFLWEVTDKETENSVWNAPNVYGFSSPVFIIGGIKWYLTFYPNGSKIERATYCNVYLHLAALPKTSMQVNIRHSQGLQGDIEMRAARFITKFDHDKDSWGLIDRSTYCTADMVKLNNFLCVAEIVVLDIYDNDKVIEWDISAPMYKSERILELIEYEWRLDDVIMNKIKGDKKEMKCYSHVFEMFGLQWRVILYPYGINPKEDPDKQDISLCLELLSSVKKNTLNIRCTFNVMELNARYITTGILDCNNLIVDWGDGRIYTKTIKNLQHCTIKIGMEVIDVYCDEECVTDGFMSK